MQTHASNGSTGIRSTGHGHFYNRVTLTFDLLFSGSMHAEQLL